MEATMRFFVDRDQTKMRKSCVYPQVLTMRNITATSRIDLIFLGDAGVGAFSTPLRPQARSSLCMLVPHCLWGAKDITLPGSNCPRTMDLNIPYLPLCLWGGKKHYPTWVKFSTEPPGTCTYSEHFWMRTTLVLSLIVQSL